MHHTAGLAYRVARSTMCIRVRCDEVDEPATNKIESSRNRGYKGPNRHLMQQDKLDSRTFEPKKTLRPTNGAFYWFRKACSSLRR